jgi:hypothetical protein
LIAASASLSVEKQTYPKPKNEIQFCIFAVFKKAFLAEFDDSL